MTVSANNAVDIKALLYALTQQREPLPEPLQHALQEAGQALQQNQPEAAYRLREHIESYLPLDNAYKDALQELDTFANSPGLDWFFTNDVIPARDWVATAKQAVPMNHSRSTEDEVFEKANRIAVMTIGGACIGAAIAQLLGAIIGGAIAMLYGWYISFAKKRQRRIFR